MLKINHQNVEKALFFSAFVIALLLRLIRLDNVPLSDFEANLALQSLGIAQNSQPVLSGQPAYILPTAVLFFIFGTSDFLARLIPAIAGSFLILAAYLFRDRFPGWSAVALAFLFAIDPGLVALSREAGSPMLAVVFTLLALGLWRNHCPAWAGFFGGLAFLSGTALWLGLISLALAYLATGGAGWMHPPFSLEPGAGATESRGKKWKAAFISAGAAWLVAGTLFFLSPNGLNAAFTALPDYLRGWFTPGGIQVMRPLIVLGAHHVFMLLFALIAVVRGALARSRMTAFLAAWAFAALVLALIYPARQVSDLVWVLIPLAALAAFELGRAMEWDNAEAWETIGTAILTFAVLVFAYLDFQSLALNTYGPEDTRIRWLLFGGAFLLLGLSILLVALGWSFSVARRGALFGSIVVLTLYTLNAATGAAGMRFAPTQSPWRIDPQTGQAAALLKTVEDLSLQKTSDPTGLEIVIYNVQSPALRWLLRHHNVRVTQGLSGGETPALVIGPLDPNAAFASSYRGQDFTWKLYPGWDSLDAAGWLKWVASHNTAAGYEQVILWARSDLFLDSQNK